MEGGGADATGRAAYAPLPEEEGRGEAAPAPARDAADGGLERSRPSVRRQERQASLQAAQHEPVPRAAACLARWCTRLSGAHCPRCCKCVAWLVIWYFAVFLGFTLYIVRFMDNVPKDRCRVLTNVPSAMVVICGACGLIELHALHSSDTYAELLQAVRRSREAPTRSRWIPALLLFVAVLGGPLSLIGPITQGALSLDDPSALANVVGEVLVVESLSVVWITSFLPLCVCVELAYEHVTTLKEMISNSDWQEGHLVFESLFTQYQGLAAKLLSISQATSKASSFILAQFSFYMVCLGLYVWVEVKEMWWAEVKGPGVAEEQSFSVPLSPDYFLPLPIFVAGAYVTSCCDKLAGAALDHLKQCSESSVPAGAAAGLLQFSQLVHDQPTGFFLLPGWRRLRVGQLRLEFKLLWAAASPLWSSGTAWCVQKLYDGFEDYYESGSRDVSPIFLFVFYGLSVILLIVFCCVCFATRG